MADMDLDENGHSEWAKQTAQDAEIEVRDSTKKLVAKGIPEPIANQLAWNEINERAQARSALLAMLTEAIETSPVYRTQTQQERMEFIRRAIPQFANLIINQTVKRVQDVFKKAADEVVLELECRMEASESKPPL